VGSLAVSLSLNTQQFAAGMARAEREMERFRAALGKQAGVGFDELRTGVMAGEQTRLNHIRRMGEVYAGLGIPKGKGEDREAIEARLYQIQKSSLATYDQSYNALQNMTTASAALGKNMGAAQNKAQGFLNTTIRASIALMAINRSVRFALDHADEIKGAGGSAGGRYMQGVGVMAKNAVTFGYWNDLVEAGGGNLLEKSQKEQTEDLSKLREKIQRDRVTKQRAQEQGSRSFDSTARDADFQGSLIGLDETETAVANLRHEQQESVRILDERAKDLRDHGQMSVDLEKQFGDAKYRIYRSSEDRITDVINQAEDRRLELVGEHQARELEARGQEYERKVQEAWDAVAEEQRAGDKLTNLKAEFGSQALRMAGKDADAEKLLIRENTRTRVEEARRQWQPEIMRQEEAMGMLREAAVDATRDLAAADIIRGQKLAPMEAGFLHDIPGRDKQKEADEKSLNTLNRIHRVLEEIEKKTGVKANVNMN
jgi:hypothetical protein